MTNGQVKASHIAAAQLAVATAERLGEDVPSWIREPANGTAVGRQDVSYADITGSPAAKAGEAREAGLGLQRIPMPGLEAVTFARSQLVRVADAAEAGDADVAPFVPRLRENLMRIEEVVIEGGTGPAI